MLYTICSLLIEGFLKENHSAEVFKGTRSGEEELTESPPVCLHILHINAGKTLANCAGGLVSSEDTLSRGANIGSIGNKLICSMLEISYNNLKIFYSTKKQGKCL